ncbi:hypothetical protein EGK75_03060 [Neisseria weixii]|uniref:Uncharacterized protein n=2 Tax=Neisseria weixii TaxID=1853276 RepID=A0A3N4N3C0_9NEIS|nr:hypothetical protein EGK74_03060 [Neisseria weixii]RPD90007.1 hypothetical protein EGK75_03060 [Neisseria weixii]
MNDRYFLDSFRTPVPPDFQFEAKPQPEPEPEHKEAVKPDEAPKHPEEIAAQAVGNAVTVTGGAAGSIHHYFMGEADKLKNTISVNHDVKNGLTRVMAGIEQDKISSAELRNFYAKHPEALKEVVEEIAGNSAEVRQQHGDLITASVCSPKSRAVFPM